MSCTNTTSVPVTMILATQLPQSLVFSPSKCNRHKVPRTFCSIAYLKKGRKPVVSFLTLALLCCKERQKKKRLFHYTLFGQQLERLMLQSVAWFSSRQLHNASSQCAYCDYCDMATCSGHVGFDYVASSLDRVGYSHMRVFLYCAIYWLLYTQFYSLQARLRRIGGHLLPTVFATKN